jgi:LysM repeat protein
MRTRLTILGLAFLVAAALLAAVPTGQASANGRVHCVKYGETLYGIAAMYGTSASALASANGIWNPNYLRAGSCLTIPAGYGYGHGYGHNAGYDYGYGYKKPDYGYGHCCGYDWGYGKDYDHGYKKPGYGHGYGRTHCVKYGETLYSIAWRYGVSVWSLSNANGIHNPNWIRAGSCLTIPGW